MKALTWKEPFCTLMEFGKWETRTWDTKVRGEVLICAAKKCYDLGEQYAIMGQEQYAHAERVLTNAGKNTLPYGVAKYIGTLVDSLTMHPQYEDRCFVKYREGLWVHIYENVRAIVPFEWKGKQGWKEVPIEIINQIIFKS